MKLRSILAGTALAALMLTGAPHLGAPAAVGSAEAAVNVSIGVFYNQLGQYGDWVNYNDSYVFIPSRVDAGWRPYTRGHWVFTKRYGWTWASDEPFGWATYHYGRWGYSEDIGWYWVPGRRWAPAWVSWRRSNDYVVWAPLPPRHGGGTDVSIDISVGDIPDYYWVAVPTRRFLAPDLRVAIVNDDRDIRQVVQRSEYIGTPRITNNIVVNNVIDVNVISRETGQKVKPVEVRTTDDPAKSRASADQVTAFQGEIATDTKVKPKKLSDVSNVRKVKRKQGAGDATSPGQTTEAPATDGDAAVPADGTASGNKQTGIEASSPAAGRKKKLQNQNASTPGSTAEQPAAQDQQTGKKKRKQQNQDAVVPDKAGNQNADQGQDQPSGKKKRKLQNQNAATPSESNGQPSTAAQDQQPGKTKRKLIQQGDEATGSTSQAPKQKGGNGNAAGQQDQNANAAVGDRKGKGKKNQTTCDPTVDANCAPAE